jgi:hypothetical protein
MNVKGLTWLGLRTTQFEEMVKMLGEVEQISRIICLLVIAVTYLLPL